MRLRKRLFAALLSFEIGFYDTTWVGAAGWGAAGAAVHSCMGRVREQGAESRAGREQRSVRPEHPPRSGLIALWLPVLTLPRLLLP